jgi:purine-binding chemotaxis protein CheW
MNLRGQVISVIDLRMKMKMPKAEASPETAIIILDLSPLSLGVIVDSVESVLAVEKQEIQPPPDVGGKDAMYISGVTRKDSKLILLLDIEKTLSVEDLRTMKAQAA